MRFFFTFSIITLICELFVFLSGTGTSFKQLFSRKGELIEQGEKSDIYLSHINDLVLR